MDFNNFSEEQKAQVRECKTPEELMALANEMSCELSDSELEAIAGGGHWCFDDCSDNQTPPFPI